MTHWIILKQMWDISSTNVSVCIPEHKGSFKKYNHRITVRAGLHTLTAKDTGSISGQVSQVPQATWCGKKIKFYRWHFCIWFVFLPYFGFFSVQLVKFPDFFILLIAPPFGLLTCSFDPWTSYKLEVWSSPTSFNFFSVIFHGCYSFLLLCFSQLLKQYDSVIERRSLREFPGGPMIRSWHFTALTLVKKLRSHKPCVVAKKKKSHYKLIPFFGLQKAQLINISWLVVARVCGDEENGFLLICIMGELGRWY